MFQLKKTILLKKTVIVEEELDDIDREDIGNLEALLRLISSIMNVRILK